jgi:hypothetical protein
LARAVRRKKQEAIVFDFTSSLPRLPPRTINGVDTTSKRNTVKDIVDLEDRLTLFKDKHSMIPHTASEVDDGARCSPPTTQTNSPKTGLAVQVQVADHQQDLTATTAVHLRLTARELVAVTAQAIGGQTGLRKVERRDLQNLE